MHRHVGKQYFAMDTDENKIIIKAVAIEYAKYYLLYRAEENEASPLTH